MAATQSVMLRMTYLALARKWRPRLFSQLIGQDHVSKPLINALKQQRIHHAYLFTGTRGVGKTSVARILAKALNCTQGVSPEPCLVCDACLAIEQGRFIDLIEIDGASKTRVEDTREVLDNVQYAPTSGRFKIYLIDEVHMLSQHSFNALLKTLEEPPAHVKFILATTDPQKVPVTVLSRCLQFNLHHLTEALIKAHLEYILNQEQTAYEEGALAILAYAAQGSMRDALSLLDQTITGCEDKLLVRDVKALLGYTQQDYAQQVLQALARQEGPQLIELSRQIVVEGGHFNYVLDQILHYVHQIALYQQLGKESPLLVSTPEIVDLAAHFSAEDIQLFYQISLKGREEINLAPSLFIGFNMVLLRMLMFRPVSDCSSLSLDPPAASPPTAVETNSQKNADNQEAPEGSPKLRAVPPDVAAPSQSSKPIDASNWSHIVTQLKLTGLALNAISNAEFVAKDQKTITLKVAKGHYSLFTPTTFSKIEHGLSHYLNTPVKINLLTEQQIQASPAQEKERSLSEQKQKASSELENDVVLQRIKKEFSAELVKNSIVLLKDGL